MAKVTHNEKTESVTESSCNVRINKLCVLTNTIEIAFIKRNENDQKTTKQQQQQIACMTNAEVEKGPAKLNAYVYMCKIKMIT